MQKTATPTGKKKIMSNGLEKGLTSLKKIVFNVKKVWSLDQWQVVTAPAWSCSMNRLKAYWNHSSHNSICPNVASTVRIRLRREVGSWFWKPLLCILVPLIFIFCSQIRIRNTVKNGFGLIPKLIIHCMLYVRASRCKMLMSTWFEYIWWVYSKVS